MNNQYEIQELTQLNGWITTKNGFSSVKEALDFVSNSVAWDNRDNMRVFEPSTGNFWRF
jgi:hypothetical protein